jgi:hypothetical protein
MKIRVIRKNKRRIDPRYFLHENVEEEETEEKEEPEEKPWPPPVENKTKDLETKDGAPADLRALTLPEEDRVKLLSVIESAFKNKPYVSLNDIKGALESAGLQFAKEEQ